MKVNAFNGLVLFTDGEDMFKKGSAQSEPSVWSQGTQSQDVELPHSFLVLGSTTNSSSHSVVKVDKTGIVSSMNNIIVEPLIIRDRENGLIQFFKLLKKCYRM